MTEFGWPTYKVEPLQESEKKDIIHGYMGLYGKTLNQEQTDLIINAKQSSNPLYLKALLDEVEQNHISIKLVHVCFQCIYSDEKNIPNARQFASKVIFKLDKAFHCTSRYFALHALMILW